MALRRLVLFLGLLLSAGKLFAQVQDSFVISTWYDPYTNARCRPDSVESWFDTLAALGVTHLMGAGEDTVVREAAQRGIKVIALNGNNLDKCLISSAEPKYLDDFARRAYYSDFEVENELRTAEVGYIFRRQPTVSTEVTENGKVGLKSFVSTHQPGYMFTGPPQPSNYDPPDCPPYDSSSRHFSPHEAGNTWCRADFVMSVGDKNGSPDTVVAMVVVANLNGWCRTDSLGTKLGWCKSVDTIFNNCYSTDFCLCENLYGLPPIGAFKQQAVTSFGDTVWVDTLILDSQGRWDTTKTLAWMRKVKVSDFSAAQTLDTISFSYLQLVDNPYRFQVYWTDRKDVFVDKITISNFAGRKLDSLAGISSPEYDFARDQIEAYYTDSLELDTLPAGTLARWFLGNEPYGGSIPGMNAADILARSFSVQGQTPRQFTNYHVSWRNTRAYQDYLNLVSPLELSSEMFANSCNTDDSTWWPPVDTLVGGIWNRQRIFDLIIADMKDLYQRANSFGKKFWMNILIQDFLALDKGCGGTHVRHLRSPSEAELNAEVFLALAYGAKGINYEHYASYYHTGFGPCPSGSPALGARLTCTCGELVAADPTHGILAQTVLQGAALPCPPCESYSNPSQWGGYQGQGMIQWDNSISNWKPNDRYYWAKKINTKLKKLGATIMQSTWQGAGSASSPTGIGGSFITSVSSAQYSIDRTYVELAFFSGDHFMLVNRRVRAHEGQDVTLWLNKSDHRYVIDLVTGDTVLTGNTGASGAPFTTHLDPGQGKLFKVVPAPTYIHGTLNVVAIQGKVTFDGDGTIPFGKTVKFLGPKCQVVLLANRDTLHAGVNTNKVEFIGKGKVEIRGVPGDTVKFVSSASSPGLEDWYGFRIDTTTGASGKFEYGLFKHAYSALDYKNTATDTVKNCWFENNEIYGVRTKNGNLKVLSNVFKNSAYGVYLDSANAKVDGSNINNCYIGILSHKSFGTISNNTITTSGSSIMEAGFYQEGYVSGSSQSQFSGDSVSGRYNAAAVVADGGTYINGCRIWQVGPQPITENETYYVAVLSFGTNQSKMRATTVKMSNLDNTGLPAILVYGTPVMDLDAPEPPIFPPTQSNRVFRASGSKAVQNNTTTTVLARYNWWGTASPDSTTLFSGKVSFRPFLDCDPPQCGPAKISSNTEVLPSEYSLGQNYPNPFNPRTAISFSLPQSERVKLEVFNLLGQRVRTLADGDKPAGVFSVEWDGRDEKGVPVASGIYLYRLEASKYREVKKMVFLK